MSHFPRADEVDKSFSHEQIEAFRGVMKQVAERGIEVFHMANSAAIFDLPDSHLDAARPGISIYGLRPSEHIANPRVRELLPVLEWKTRITFLKEIPAGTGVSYGHTFRAERPLLVATLPVGYGDGLSRRLSNDHEVLVHGVRCRQLGRISMDQSQVDVSALRGRVALGDEAVLIGRQGAEEVTADELARKIGTINYEIVTAISARVPRIVLSSGGSRR
jgi:alanine racemase